MENNRELEAKIKAKVLEELEDSYTRGTYYNLPIKMIALSEKYRFADESKTEFVKEALQNLIDKRKAQYD